MLLTDQIAMLLAPGVGRQLIGVGLLVCGSGLALAHLAVLHVRYEKLNQALDPKDQFDPVHMREEVWQFEKMFHMKFPRDKSLFIELGCVIGGFIMSGIGFSLLFPKGLP
jgi:hypothetical protein